MEIQTEPYGNDGFFGAHRDNQISTDDKSYSMFGTPCPIYPVGFLSPHPWHYRPDPNEIESKSIILRQSIEEGLFATIHVHTTGLNTERSKLFQCQFVNPILWIRYKVSLIRMGLLVKIKHMLYIKFPLMR